MIVASSLVTTLFLGGWSFFGLERLGWGVGLLLFAVKTLFLLFVFIWIRWTLPRFRYDQLMGIGWKWFFPLALVNVLVTAAAEAFDVPVLAYVVPVLLVGPRRPRRRRRAAPRPGSAARARCAPPPPPPSPR